MKSKSVNIKNVVLSIVIILMININMALAYCVEDEGYCHEILTGKAISLIKEKDKNADFSDYLNQPDPFGGAIKKGAGDEDWPIWRVKNHFFHPLTKAGFGNQKNAPEWSVDSYFLGFGNEFTWQEAINRYDYSSGSKINAYEYLGHTVHLVQDMSVPSHTHVDVHLSPPLGLPGGEPDDYETYVKNDASIINTFPVNNIPNLPSRYDYFSKMAELSYYRNRYPADLDTIDSQGKLKDMYPDLNYTEVIINDVVAFAYWNISNVGFWYDVWGGHNKDTVKLEDDWWETIHETGNINENDSFYYIENTNSIPPKEEKKAWYPRDLIDDYEDNINNKPIVQYYAEQLLPLAVEYSAGLIQFYYKIVNHPPYVKMVKVIQIKDGVEKEIYEKKWEDSFTTMNNLEIITDRSLIDISTTPVNERFAVSGSKLKFLIEFSEPVKDVVVNVGSKPATELVLDKNIWTGELDINPADTSLEGEQTIGISAVDLDGHYNDIGGKLDSDPSTPAKRKVPGNNPDEYQWKNYENNGGEDKNHKIKIVFPPTVESTNPADGQTNVDFKPSVKVVFSTKMNRGITQQSFVIVPRVGGTFNWWDDKTMVFKPRRSLDPNTEYTVAVGGRDEYDLEVDGDSDGDARPPYVFKFTTRKYRLDITASPQVQTIPQNQEGTHYVTIKNGNIPKDRGITLTTELENTEGWGIENYVNGATLHLEPGDSHQLRIIIRNINAVKELKIKVNAWVEGIAYSREIFDGGPPSEHLSDHPDDSFIISSPRYPTPWLVDTESDTGILMSGWGEAVGHVLGRYNVSTAIVKKDLTILDEPYRELNDLKVLIIGSAGLTGLDNSPTFRKKLAGFVENGGTLVVFTGQHGYEFNALPGGEVSGYGWREDESCQGGSVALTTYHPVLAGQESTTPSINIDGYFTKWPKDAKILLTRTKNGMPALIMYKYGDGRVIATTMYDDWAYSSSGATKDGLNLIRDIVAWARNPEGILEFQPDKPADISLNVTNREDTAADRIIVNLFDPDNKFVKNFSFSDAVLPGETKMVNFTHTFSRSGIWHAGYALLDSNDTILQEVNESLSFAVSKYDANLNGFEYKGAEISFDATVEDEYVPYGGNVIVNFHLYNRGDHERNITINWGWDHNIYGTVGSFIVPPNSSLNIPFATGVGRGNRFYAFFYENGGFLGASYPAVYVFSPSIGVSVLTDKKQYVKNDTVYLTVKLANNARAEQSPIINIKILDTTNSMIFEESRSVNISALGYKNEYLNFSLPSRPTTGPYLVKVEVLSGNNKIGYGSTYFEVPPAHLKLDISKPEMIIPGANSTFIFNVTNTGIGDAYDSRLNITLLNPAGNAVLSNSMVFNISSNQSIAFPFGVLLSEVDFGKYVLRYSLNQEKQEIKGEISLPNSDIITLDFDKPSYRIRENLSAVIGIANSGMFYQNTSMNISISDVNFSNNTAINIKPGESFSTDLNLTLPDSLVPGNHVINVTIALNNTLSKTFAFYIPESSLIASFDSLNVYAGDNLSADIKNVGGVDTTVNYTLILKGNGFFNSTNGIISVRADASRKVYLPLHPGLKDGEYVSILNYNNLRIDTMGYLREQVHVNGMDGDVKVSTNQKAFLTDNIIETLSNITSQKKVNGTLNLRIYSNSTVPRSSHGQSFQENFSNPKLDSSWQVVEKIPGLGRYSLIDNPGYLRYYLEGSMVYNGGWTTNYSIGSWRPGMTLIRPFDGDNWALESKITYNLHERRGSSSTGAQGSNLYIAFGNGSKNYISIYRVVDYWYRASRLDIAIANSNGTPLSYYNDSLRAPDDTDKNEWLRYTYWYRVERNREKVSIWLSYDGMNYKQILSFILPSTVEETQRIILDEALWSQAGSYVDWDYINVEASQENLRDDGGFLWETNVPVDFSSDGLSVSEKVNISSDLNRTTGRFVLVGTLFSNSSQILSSSNSTFYVFDTDTTISLETDKEVYRPSEPVAISSDVRNWANAPTANITFLLDATGNELLRETFKLDANETRSFNATYSSEASFIINASIGNITISLPVEVEAPSLKVNVTSPDVAGRKEFIVTTLLENPGKLDINETLDVEGNIYNLQIPGGGIRLVETPFVINQNKTVNITLRGDIDLDISKFVVFGENASLKVLPEQVYPPGWVELPYTIRNTGTLETEFTATFNLEDKIIEKAVFLPHDGNFSSSLIFNLSEGKYTLNYTTPFEAGNTSFRVARMDFAGMNATIPKKASGGILPITVNVSNLGANSFMGNIEIDTGFYSNTSLLNLDVGEKQDFSFEVPTLIPGVFNATVRLLHNGNIIEEKVGEFEVLGPEFTVISAPTNLSYRLGEDVTMSFGILNTGGMEGTAGLNLTIPGIYEGINNSWIAPGEEKNLRFSFILPDDLEEKSYRMFYGFNGDMQEGSFFVKGANISVEAALDKPLYNEGDTVVLTLLVKNNRDFDLPLFSRVKFNDYDNITYFNLSGSGSDSLSFNVPVHFTGDKIFYSVYMASGRSLYINSMYAYEKPKDESGITLYTDKQVYLTGENVNVFVNVTGDGTLNMTAPGFTDTRSLKAGDSPVISFNLPELKSGTYYIDYTFGTFSSSYPFDVDGYSAKILEFALDKDLYDIGDTMNMKMLVEANREFPGTLKMWVYGRSEEDSFEFSREFLKGENRIEINRTLKTSWSGIHSIVYGIYTDLSGSSVLLASGAEYFDVIDHVTPQITITSPQNIEYTTSSVPLIFTIEDTSDIEWTGYSLDGADNVTISGSTMLTELTNINHTIIVYAIDSAGNTGSASTSFMVNVTQDTMPPVISNVSATGATDSAVIMWETDEASDSLVKYGTTAGNYPLSASSAGMVILHSLDISDIAHDTIYYYVVNSTDAVGNSGESGEHTFRTLAPQDNTPPASIKILGYTIGTTWINWTWINPSDTDFNHTIVNLNGTWKADISGSFFNATGFAPDTVYEIETRTVDTAGNMNASWVNSTAKTLILSDTTPPASIKILGYTKGTTWINWTWINPSDSDFNHTIVNLNGTWKANISGSYFNATGLAPDTVYEIETRTVDKVGNMNASWVNGTARTLAAPDNAAPVIKNISVVPATDSAVITWETDEASDSRVKYGISSSDYSFNRSSTEIVVWHPITLTDLVADTLYYYVVNSTDAHGNSNESAQLTFRTFAFNDKPVSATVDVKPDTLNKASKSDKNAVTVYIEIPGYSVNAINVSTVTLNTLKGNVSAQLSPTEVGDYDSDGIPDRMVKFDRQAVIAIVDVGDKVKITIRGKIAEAAFEGIDEIRVIEQGKK
jgi:hypothetical protein